MFMNMDGDKALLLSKAEAAAKRHANNRFRRNENELELECKQTLGLVQYIPPPPGEESKDTSVRRKNIRRKLKRLKPDDLQTATSQTTTSTPQHQPVVIDDVSIDITQQLLESMNINNIKLATCKYNQGYASLRNVSRVYIEGEGGCAEHHKYQTHCNAVYCHEIGVSFHVGSSRNVLGRRYIASNILKQINIDGQELCRLANNITGSAKGLRTRRTINYFIIRRDGEPQRFVDPGPEEHVLKFEMDVDDIDIIIDGEIHKDTTPQKQMFEITGKGGLPIYAVGDINNAQYDSNIEDTDRSLHIFGVPLISTVLQRNQLKTLLSSEVRINGKMFITVGESSRTLSYIEGTGGDRYKVVTHTLERHYDESEWGNYECLNLCVKFGPLPEDWEVTDYKDDEDDDPYILLMKKSFPIEFTAVNFIDSNLRKGSTLHSIAVAQLEQGDS